MHDIFLSYSRTDNEMMRRVKQSFLNAGFKVWTDEGIEPGTDDWQKAIEEALKETKSLVCLCSPDAKNSRWVKAELKHAELRKKSIFLILMRGDELDAIPFGYQHHQYIDIRPPNDYDTKISYLIRTIQKKLGLGARKPTVKELLPPPFDWCEIPAGKVSIEAGGYVPKGGQSFDVPAFLMAKYPVTNAQYAKFVDADGYKNKKWWTEAGWTWKERDKWTEPRNWKNFNYTGDEKPVVGVSWYESIAFCLWLSESSGEKITLPTEQQWQRAAQGDDRRTYPWGNDFDKAKANTGEGGIGTTTAVTAYPNGVSPFGVFDMTGNVWEWCLTEYYYPGGNIDIQLQRGGAFNTSSTSYARAAYRAYAEPYLWLSYLGFRICAAMSLD